MKGSHFVVHILMHLVQKKTRKHKKNILTKKRELSAKKTRTNAKNAVFLEDFVLEMIFKTIFEQPKNNPLTKLPYQQLEIRFLYEEKNKMTKKNEETEKK
eukprot:GEMP01132232.1.p1 GENE.GEMP01132232.1~~GEMP01132232.1.p1  ORF type:complete len:100 (-),score=4.21 GEMP01132232.1:23-322(-)